MKKLLSYTATGGTREAQIRVGFELARTAAEGVVA